MIWRLFFSSLPRSAACLLFACVGTRVSALDVCPGSVETPCLGACVLRVPVLVSGSAALDAVGLDFTYQGSASYWGWERGNVVRAWQVFDVATVGAQHLRLGGYEPHPFSLSGTDTLVVLIFEADANAGGCLFYRTEAFVDDLASAPPCEGTARAFRVLPFGPGGFVGVYPEGSSSCCYPTPDLTVLEVRALLPSSGMFQGAEFRIEVSPPAPGAQLTWQPSSSLLPATGNPIDNTAAADDSSGTVVRFSSCRSRPQGEVLVGTIQVAGLHDAHELLVKRHNRPSRPGASCAQFVTCDACSATVCMAQADPGSADPLVFRARINTSCRGCVPVEPLTWSHLKKIYK